LARCCPRTFALAVPSPRNPLPQGTAGLSPSLPLRLASNVSFSVRPSLTPGNKTALLFFFLTIVLFCFVLFEPPDPLFHLTLLAVLMSRHQGQNTPIFS
uniref:Uncharacterized protein n=1 Tax=Sus scrofa TaxID=9823 RepID=A0A4X1TPC8_PIG